MRSDAGRTGTFAASREAALAFRAQLKAEDFRPVYILGGADHHLREVMLRALINALLPGADHQGGLVTFDGRETRAERIAAELESIGLAFDDIARRVIVVRSAPYYEAGKAEAAEPLLARLEAGLAPDHHLVIEVAGAVDAKRRLTKAVAARGVVLELAPLATEEDARVFLRQRAKRAGQQLDPDAAAELVARCGLNSTLLANELDKISAYVGEGPVLSVADVRMLVTAQTEPNVFALVDATCAGDSTAAMGELRTLLASGSDAFAILGMLVRQYRLLLQARWLLDAGLADAQMTRLRSYEWSNRLDGKSRGPSLRERWATDGEGVLPLDDRTAITQQKPYPVQKTLGLAHRLSAELIEAGLERLLQTDLQFKSSRLPAALFLESAIGDLCLRPTLGASVDLTDLLAD